MFQNILRNNFFINILCASKFPTKMQTMKIIDGNKAYVLVAKAILFTGMPVIPRLMVGKTNLPTTNKPMPRTICKEPKTQNQGPKNVQGLFLERVLSNVKINKINQRAAKTNKPINKPNAT